MTNFWNAIYYSGSTKQKSIGMSIEYILSCVGNSTYVVFRPTVQCWSKWFFNDYVLEKQKIPCPFDLNSSTAKPLYTRRGQHYLGKGYPVQIRAKSNKLLVVWENGGKNHIKYQQFLSFFFFLNFIKSIKLPKISRDIPDPCLLPRPAPSDVQLCPCWNFEKTDDMLVARNECPQA